MKQSASQTAGPFFHILLAYEGQQNSLNQEQTKGERIEIAGVVYDGEGQPIDDAMLEIWQADAQGIYGHAADPMANQADPHFHGFGRTQTAGGGRYEFHTIKPGGREGEAPHINVRIFARGMLMHAMTRIYFGDEQANAADPVLLSLPESRRQTLIAEPEATAGRTRYTFNVCLQGANETVFFDPE